VIVVVTGCPDCGRVTVPVVHVTLHVRDHADRNRFSFTCPSCEAWISLPASARDVRMLRDVCVQERLERVPKELLEQRSGPALTLDDLIDFGLQLGATDLLAVLI
jgi:hypothetical protein